MGRVAGTLALNPLLGHSHAAYMIIRGIESLAKGRGGLKSNKRTTLDSIFALPPEMLGDGEKIFAEDLTYSRKVDLQRWQSRGFVERLLETLSLPVRREL